MKLFSLFNLNNVYIMPCPYCNHIGEYYDGINTCKMCNKIFTIDRRQ